MNIIESLRGTNSRRSLVALGSGVVGSGSATGGLPDSPVTNFVIGKR